MVIPTSFYSGKFQERISFNAVDLRIFVGKAASKSALTVPERRRAKKRVTKQTNALHFAEASTLIRPKSTSLLNCVLLFVM